MTLTDDNIHKIRSIVRDETDDLRHDVTGLKKDMIYLKDEVMRNSVLMEDLGDQFKVVMEMLGANLDVKKQVDNHEPRIVKLETDSKLTKQTLTSHSQQLKPPI